MNDLETTSEFVLMLLSLGTIAAMIVYLRKLRDAEIVRLNRRLTYSAG